MHRSQAILLLLALFAQPFLAQQVSPLRLPADARPVRYQATLDITPGSDTFSGSIEISLDIITQTSEITLHAKELTIGKVTPAPREIRKGENDLITLVYDQPFTVGAAKLEIAYAGAISRVLTDGAFQQQHAGDWYVFTKFEPITARRVFPCFDEPGYKVPWQLNLSVPKDLKAFSNTPAISEEAATGGRKMVKFLETKPLPSYLLAFAVGPFDVLETAPVGRNHVPSRIVVPKGRAAEAEYAASITPKLIEMLEGYFGSAYPFEKLDQVVVPLTTAWGAMENAGMIVYGDFFLAPKTQDSELRHQQLAVTMEHEMSHQWFGDLVTMQWWNDLWLNEAFASWISNKLVAGWHPEWRINEHRAAADGVFRADSLTSARKIRQPIEAAGDIGTSFDSITYIKGQAVIGMFEHYLGDAAFARGVREYLKAHASGNATSDDLLVAFDKVSPGSGAGAAFHKYLDQVGFPLVGVTLDCTSKPELRLTQRRLVPTGSSAQENALWDVPVCVSWEKGSQCVLLKTPVQSFPLKTKTCPAAVFADSGASGYYAFSYSPANNDKLMQAGFLSLTEKAAFLRNIRVLFGAGIGDLQQQLQMAATLSRNGDPNVLQESATMLGGVERFVPAELQSAYKTRLQNLYGQRALELGWKPKTTDTPELRALRNTLVPLMATQGGNTVLSAEALTLADGWFKDHSSLAAETVPGLLYAAAWNGGQDLFDQMATSLRSTKIQRERSWILKGMSGFRDAAIIPAALALIGAPGLDARETSVLLFSASEPGVWQDAIWQYVQANFDHLNTTLPSARGVPFASRLPDTAAGFCDVAHADAAEAFFKARLEPLPGGPKNLARALERIRLCASQAEVAGPAVSAFLRP